MEPLAASNTHARIALAQRIGAEGTGAPKKAPRAESKPQTEDIPREALHLVPPSLEWLPRGRDKSLRPDDGRKTPPLCRLAPGSRKAEHQGAQRSHGETGTDP